MAAPNLDLATRDAASSARSQAWVAPQSRAANRLAFALDPLYRSMHRSGAADLRRLRPFLVRFGQEARTEGISTNRMAMMLRDCLAASEFGGLDHEVHRALYRVLLDWSLDAYHSTAA